MAYLITTPPKPKAGTSSTIEVPDEVRSDIEALYEHLRSNPGLEAHVKFDTEDERKLFTRQVKAHAATREAGVLKFRQLPSKHLPATEMRFNLTADLPANGERNATK